MKNNPMTKECFLRALQRHRERVIYAFGWAVVLLSPFLMMYFRSRNSSDPLPWGFYGAVWATMGVFLVFFLFHNRFVAPLFFRPRKGRYFIFAFLLVLLLGVFQYLTFPLFGPPPPEKRSRHEVIVRDKEGKTVRGVEVRVLRFAKPGIVERVDLASLFILTLMFGVNLGVKIYFRSEDTSRELMLLQQEKLSNQLKYLKAQINPHFFMNTLNNIHALVDIDPGRAQSSIILLSRMMRYVVYEREYFYPATEGGGVSLQLHHADAPSFYFPRPPDRRYAAQDAGGSAAAAFHHVCGERLQTRRKLPARHAYPHPYGAGRRTDPFLLRESEDR